MSNEMLMGSIPGSGGGLRKTYEESLIFIDVSYRKLAYTLREDHKKQKLYLDDDNRLVLESEIDSNYNGKYREAEIIGFYCYGVNSSNYCIEVIEKRILHEHLEQDREMRLRLLK